MSSGTPTVPLLLCGQTAVGKSAVALELAERLGAEIISVDSMQVYRGMDIGTAKPSAAERARVPHHLLDICALRETFDAAAFVEHATKCVNEILGRGRLPLFCGGTGLYFKSYLFGLSQAPSSDPALRAELANTPLPDLLAELAKLDPEAYASIDRQNPRRVIRALQVIRLSGKPFSAQRKHWSPEPDPGRGICVGLMRDPADLRGRIDARVDQMFQRGLVDETRRLLQQGLEQNPVALQALGYRQVVEHLQGARTLKETIELVKVKTRQFARRQNTWFKRQLPVRWVKLDPGTSPAQCAEHVIRAYTLACQ